MIITTHAYARAGLVGNPSDGYYGKTISFIIRNFKTTIQLWESPRLEILPAPADLCSHDSLEAMLRDARLYGYYGGIRLIRAAIKKFTDYCHSQGISLPKGKNFTLSYSSDVPRLVGLSGSSAIVVATLRALCQFYNVTIPQHYLPTLALSAERDELKITAGLQDRVIQTYEGMVHMDFDRAHVEKNGYGIYEPLKPAKLPPIYVAYDPGRAEVSDITHRNLRAMFDSGDPTVVGAMKQFRDIVTRARTALLAADWPALAACNNEGFDLRKTIMDIAPENQRMIDVARATGASAAFAGSGGAICGLYHDGRQYQKLADELAKIRCTVFRPLIFDV
jgi:glucuronokinase